MEKESVSIKFLKDTAVIVGFFTILSYVMTYSYEKGFKSFYHLDPPFINDITISNIVMTLIQIAKILIPVTLVAEILTDIISSKYSSNVYFKFLKMELLDISIPFIFIICLSYNNLLLVLFEIFLWIIVILPILITPKIKYRKIKGYKHQLAEYLKKDSISKAQMIINFKQSFWLKLLTVAAVIYGLSLGCQLYGSNQAKNKEEYFILKDNGKYLVVIDQYKDQEKILVAPIDLEKRLITPDFSVVEIKSNFKDLIQLKKVKLDGQVSMGDIKDT